MGGKYAATGGQAVASAADSVIYIEGTAAQRNWIYYFCLSSAGTPADNAILWIVQRGTANGTGTGVVPEPLDEAEPACVTVVEENQTAEPTYTAAAEVFDNAVNQRMTFQWSANPDGELVSPAVGEDGFGWQPSHASFTGAVEVTLHFHE